MNIINRADMFWRINGGDSEKILTGYAAPVFDRIPLAKEILVENIPLAALRSISWSWAHFYKILRNFSPNIPLSRENFQK